MTSTAIDLALMALVGWAILDGRAKSRKMAELQQALRELAPVVEQFSASVDKSEITVTGVRQAVEEGVNSINQTANSARNRLNIMAELTAPPSKKGKASGTHRLHTKAGLVESFFSMTRSGK
jgi:outer membrane murein-binding lipoprotein Lpp